VIENELVAQWEPWIQKVLGRAHGKDRTSGTVTASRSGKRFLSQLEAAVVRLERAFGFESFSLTEAACGLHDLVRASRLFSGALDYSRGQDTQMMEEGMELELMAMKAVGLYSAPLMPEFSKAVLDALGVATVDRIWEKALEPLRAEAAVRGDCGFEFAPHSKRLWRMATRKEEASPPAHLEPVSTLH